MGVGFFSVSKCELREKTFYFPTKTLEVFCCMNVFYLFFKYRDDLTTCVISSNHASSVDSSSLVITNFCIICIATGSTFPIHFIPLFLCKKYLYESLVKLDNRQLFLYKFKRLFKKKCQLFELHFDKSKVDIVKTKYSIQYLLLDQVQTLTDHSHFYKDQHHD